MDEYLSAPTNNEQITVVSEQNDAIMNLDFNNVLALANKADRLVSALNKIMVAAIKVTTPKDWCLIGGTPYLQESGATKVARLFGIGWKIHEKYPKVQLDSDGYPTYTFRMTFFLGSQSIEAEGMRSARDEFFAGKRTDKEGNPVKQKSVDEIDLADVQRAAYTNCLNRGIKSILPGLRNLDAATLEENGIKLSNSNGYTFKTGSKGGSGNSAEKSGIVCESCGSPITQSVASYSQGKFGKYLCMKCQKSKAAAQPAEERPPIDDSDVPPERR